jgi:hypothetical protein
VIARTERPEDQEPRWRRWAGMANRERDLVAGMRRIERKLDLIMARLEIEDALPELPEVSDLIDQGKRIAAIKAYRDATGAGLREAKDAVDEIADGRRRP